VSKNKNTEKEGVPMKHEIIKQKVVNEENCLKKAIFLGFLIIALAMFFIAPGIVIADDKEEGKILIIYYSRTGKTKIISETLQKMMNADLLEIKDKKDRSGTWGFISSAYDSFFDRESEIEPAHPDLSLYSSVVVVSPVWNWKISTPVITLIKNNSFKGKKFMMYTNANINIKKYDNFGVDAPFVKKFLRDYLRDKRTLMRKIVAKKGSDVVGHFHIATEKTTKAQLVQLTQNSAEYLKEKLVINKLNEIAIR
jgi:hypothetical protein